MQIFTGKKETEPEEEKKEQENKPNIPNELPVLPLRGTVVYPLTVIPLNVGQPRSIRLVDEAATSPSRSPAASGESCPQVSEWIMLGRSFDRDPAQLGELLDDRAAAEAPVAARLGAAERNLRLVLHGRAVDVAASGLYAQSD